jgi:BASS family bile acid:Na+ symporter
MCEELDGLQLNFSESNLLLLDLSLAFIMFGVALNLNVEDFKRVWQHPKKALTGVFSQFLILPALTFVFVWVLKPCPSIALGMILVAACPGGNLSNFICLLARGNVALSVSLTAIASVLSVVMTPFNFTFWASLYPPAAELLFGEIQMDLGSIFLKIFLILGLPLAMGMMVATRFPKITAKITKPIRVLSLIIFASYIVGALAANWEYVVDYVQYVILIVFFHNVIALSTGYGTAWLMRLPEFDRRSISIETGIQNAGVALVLIFGEIFNGLGGMAMIAALWGIWHLLAGSALAAFWSRREPART